jgi:hypothetical protein
VTDRIDEPSEAEHVHRLVQDGLNLEEARQRALPRQEDDPLPIDTLTVAIRDQGRDTDFDMDPAITWLHLGVPSDEAAEFHRRGWIPDDLISLREAILDTDRRSTHFPTQITLERQLDEIGWLMTSIPVRLAILYVRAGHTPSAARDLDARRQAGDTTIEPALTVLAALRTPRPV